MIDEITATEAKLLIDNENAIVVDIRDATSFAQGHIQGAMRIDNHNFQQFVDETDKSKPIIVCCYHGNSSQAATGVINSLGFSGYSLQGGMSAWILAYPVVQG